MHGHQATLIVEDDLEPIRDSELQKQAYKALTDPSLPRRLSTKPTHPDYHPSFMRVGVRIDGVEHNNLTWYDFDKKLYQVHHDPKIHQAESLEPYWRFEESRQQRRARERWEAKR